MYKYNIVKGLLWVLSLLPFPVLYVISDFLCLFVSRFYRTKVVRSNLKSAFPEKTEEELRHIEKKFYHQFCDNFVEVIKMLSMSKQDIMRRMTFSGLEEAKKRHEAGQKLNFLYLSHFGNWEWIASIAYHMEPWCASAQVYHHIYNKVMDKFFLRLRSRFNTLSVSQKQTLRLVLTLLKEGKQPILGLIADQRPRRKFATTWMRFLNQPTPLITGGETMGERIGANYVYGSMTCVKRGYYKMTIQPIEPIEGEEFSYVKQYMRMLEKDIQREPHLWLWTHKRWKFHYDKEDLL